MQLIPIADLPSQIVSATLGNQSCRLRVYQRRTSLFVDVYVDDLLVVGASVARDVVQLVRFPYLGFVGDLMFCDTQGADDPLSPGLGTRFSLIYLEAADLVAAA